jgi:hypothetical protein
MDDLINILSNSNKDIDNQKLMDYLSGQLSGEEKHELEKQMSDSDLLNDAVEGLEHFKNPKDIDMFVTQLNANLHSQIEKKKLHKRNRTFKDQPWVYLTIVLILSLIIICFIVIKKHMDSEKLKPTAPVATELTIRI